MSNQFVHHSKQLCVGCGVCAGMCDAIKMKTDEFGFYYPEVDQTVCVQCGKCVSICPMRLSNQDAEKLEKTCLQNENLSYRVETGHYLGTYEGVISQYQNTSASGGYCTSLLCELLSRKLVKSVYCARKNADQDRFFVSKRVTSCEELRRCSGSAYYPIEISETINYIRNNREKTAIVCLPCQATALRLAMKKDKVLKDSIVFLIGLVCGGIPGKGMVEYIARDLSCDLKEVTNISFREKDSGIKCNNCQIKFYHDDRQIAVSRYHGESFGFVYLNHILHNKGCNTCTDIFAEEADAVFGDAWFDENRSKELGTSICITRNPVLDEIMRDLGAGASTIDRMILAQSNVGLITRKKQFSHYYRWYYGKKGYAIDVDSKKVTNRKKQCRVILEELFANGTRRAWLDYKVGKIHFPKLKKKWEKNIEWKRRCHL